MVVISALRAWRLRSSVRKALYALNKDQVAPVRTDFGFHLIKLLGVEAPEVPTFASLKDKLTRELKTQQVEQRFVEATKQLEDSAFEASDLAQPAQDLKLTVHTSKPFGREGGEGVTANRAVVTAAFSPEVMRCQQHRHRAGPGNRHRAARQGAPQACAAAAGKRRRPDPRAMTKEHASAAAKTKADELIASLRAGKTPLDKAIDGQNWKVTAARLALRRG
jgi:peptidyl-prolyl cis-trans isomerase D